MPTPGAHISISHTFLMRIFWGGEIDLKLKTLMLGHLLRGDEAWLHATPATSCPKTLSAVTMPDETLDLGTGAVPWRSYHLTKRA